jgi:predicted phosphodiesterase
MNADNLIELFQKMENKFDKQPAVVKDNSKKILFVGDVHGDLETMSIVDDVGYGYDKIVFLGDFVDRGINDTEVAERISNMYLNDHRIIVLAGNHDASDCVYPCDWDDRLSHNFGAGGLSIRKAYNCAFKKAPVAYYNEEYKLFALHGFIPIPQNGGRWDINKWKKTDSDIINEILWNDPLLDENGVNPSERGNYIWKVGRDITEQFMGWNNLEYIVRSHQPRINKIFNLSDGKKVVNIGSSSYYGTRGFFMMPGGKIYKHL